MQFAARLDELGVRYDYEAYKLNYFVRVPGAYCAECGGREVYKQGWYLPDFWLPDYGLLVETKGRFTSRDRAKIQAVVEAHPDERLIMVFMSDNKLAKQSTTRYSEWTAKKSIPSLVKSPAALRSLKLEEITTLV